MGFAERIAVLAERAPELRAKLETEEATKNALIMPFISALGYDVFNPDEVVPEFTADVGTKKGEKVDYAIMRKGDSLSPAILVECKKVTVDLSTEELRKEQRSQLYRYFSVTTARIGILTNGLSYFFYSDIDEPNKMDENAFLEVHLLELKESALGELARLTRDLFDESAFIDAAAELKYLGQIKDVIAAQYREPDEDFCRWFFTRLNPGKHYRGAQKERFMTLVKLSLHQFVNERLKERFAYALGEDASEKRSDDKTQRAHEPASENGPSDLVASESSSDATDGIETTVEELEGYFIVKSIIRETIDSSRIQYRDSKTYFSVILDASSRKTVCRLYFNKKQKYIGIIGSSKTEERHPLPSLDHIYEHATKLKEAANSYGAAKVAADA